MKTIYSFWMQEQKCNFSLPSPKKGDHNAGCDKNLVKKYGTKCYSDSQAWDTG